MRISSAIARLAIAAFGLAVFAAQPALADDSRSIRGGYASDSNGSFYGLPYDKGTFRKWGAPEEWLDDLEPRKTREVTRDRKVLFNNDDYKLTVTKKRVVKTVLKPAKNPHRDRPTRVKNDVDRDVVERVLDDGTRIIRRTVTRTKIVTKKVGDVVKRLVTKKIFVTTLRIKSPSPT